ncbi:replication factor C large subunit [Salinarchaeum sp. Harcht-Bsk1]|uniref:replication factor C large subunit n=1 Tax=Salinarchaeum sp. Harcht-Bsk1 TaxID=1333523 RepID=UPI0003423451|nr:replication factor C large subunit [Salinarchaeum sp. Harcht-Bsk1]AGN02895.1 replication factor C large subunit [Salinarchaeum sp. Harcht-Bsk1]
MEWTEKYRPSTLTEVRGNDAARDELREWAESWEDHREAAIVHGRPGVGKTSAAHALANDLGWDVMELNASDDRTRDVVERIAGEASKSATLTGGTRRLVVLDEADNFHGNADYGGSRAVTDVVKDANQPIVLVANEFYDMSRGLRNACQEIEFRDVSARSIVPVLRDICRKEGVEFEDAALEAVAERTSGDLRSAINDLQAIAEGRDRLTEADVSTGERDGSVGIFDFLDLVIKEQGAEDALKSSYDVEETPDDLIQWIEDNVPKDYEGAELADAYDHLSNADRWLGRVRATQNYTYWRYASDAMVAGVAASRREPKGGWTRYGPPSFRSKLGRSKGTRNTRDGIAQRIAEREGCSLGTARRRVVPYLAAMTHHCKPRDLTVSVAAAYDLDAGELSFLTGSGEDTNKVQSIVEDAASLKESAAVDASQGAFEGATRDDGTTDGSDEDGVSGQAESNTAAQSDGQSTLADSGTNDDGTDSAEEDSAGNSSEPDADANGADDQEDQSGLDEFF